MSDCIFCKIVAGDIPCHKIYEDEKVLAFLDIAKDAVGHTLVIPKQHSTDILNCSEANLEAIARAVQKIGSHYVNNCGFSGFNVLVANGPSAQQSVFHLHFHIILRCDNDGINLWPLNDKYDMDLAVICDRLKLK